MSFDTPFLCVLGYSVVMRKTAYRVISLILFLQLITACSTAQYYIHGASGHLDLMAKRQPINAVLKQKSISEKRREQIRETITIRKFGHERLKLPKNNSYTSYVDVGREAISWNVIATPPYSIKPIQSCFPISGCVSYLIYFSKTRAQNVVKQHKKLGHDTHIIASPAYSTQGYFDDPVVRTMFTGSISSTAEIMFHELAHQVLYKKNDTAFNEAFASAVGEEGTQLWLKAHHPEKLKNYEAHIKKRWQFFNLLINTREKLNAFYQTQPKGKLAEQGKQKIFNQLKTDYEKLKVSWGGDKRFDRWFSKHPLNNAKLAVIGVYYQKVPEFKKTLKAFNYDFEKFYTHYRKIAAK